MTSAIDIGRATALSDAGDTATRLDAPGLQALAARTMAEPQADGAARRGPFRPEVWLNARQRHASRLAVHWFRSADIAAVSIITVALLWAMTPGGLLAASLSAALPLGVGAVVVLGLMRSLGLYRFARGQKAPLHLAAVAGLALAGGVCAVAAGRRPRGRRQPFGLCHLDRPGHRRPLCPAHGLERHRRPLARQGRPDAQHRPGRRDPPRRDA